MSNTAVRNMLTGQNAFYKKNEYQNTTKDEMARNKPLPDTIYEHHTESKKWRMIKNLFSVILFPVGLWKIIHFIAGRLIVPASSDPFDEIEYFRNSINLSGKWKMKRISVKVDDLVIDGAIIGREKTFDNGRWVLASNGNSDCYERQLNDYSFAEILTRVKGNGIVFNYPGVGSSSGKPNRKALAKAYQAMLHFLEDKKNGVGAKEIVGFGHSLGGGVQADALRTHKLKADIKYVFVKRQTFSNLSAAAADLVARPAGWLTKIFGWDIKTTEYSKKLNAPEIIMQTYNTQEPTPIKDRKAAVHIRDDGVISADASLAKRLLFDNSFSFKNKYIMGIPEDHKSALRGTTLSHLAEKINEMIRVPVKA